MDKKPTKLALQKRRKNHSEKFLLATLAVSLLGNKSYHYSYLIAEFLLPGVFTFELWAYIRLDYVFIYHSNQFRVCFHRWNLQRRKPTFRCYETYRQSVADRQGQMWCPTIHSDLSIPSALSKNVAIYVWEENHLAVPRAKKNHGRDLNYPPSYSDLRPKQLQGKHCNCPFLMAEVSLLLLPYQQKFWLPQRILIYLYRSTTLPMQGRSIYGLAREENLASTNGDKI